MKENKLEALKKQSKKNKKTEKKFKEMTLKCSEDRELNSRYEEVIKNEKNANHELQQKQAELREIEEEIEQLLINMS